MAPGLEPALVFRAGMDPHFAFGVCTPRRFSPEYSSDFLFQSKESLHHLSDKMHFGFQLDAAVFSYLFLYELHQANHVA